MKPFSNPVVEVYRNRKIKMYNKITIRVSAKQMKEFINAKDDLGLTAIEAIQQKKALCNICNGIEVKIINNATGNRTF